MKIWRYLFVLLSIFLGARGGALEIHVSKDGLSGNTGKKESPLPFGEAMTWLSGYLKKNGVPEKGVTVLVQPGEYFFESRFVLGPEFQGTKERPIVIRADGDGEVWFNGSKDIEVSSFTKVTSDVERARLSAQAVDQIMVTTISDPKLISKLNRKLMSNLIFDGKSYLPAVFPNSGYAKLKSQAVTPEVSPPAILPSNVDYGVRAGRPPQQEPGKPFGWKGSLKEPRGARAGFSDKANEMAGTWQQWEDELKRNNRRNALTGFIEANWLLSSQPIYAASGKDRCIHLSRALAYGWNWKEKDKPFRVFGMLCELDQPGEWHFDPLTKRLFIYPVGSMGKDASVRVALANGFIKLHKTRHVSVIGLSVRNIGGGSVYEISRGERNLVAGCTIRDSVAAGLYLSGERNTARGCDLIDLNHHVILRGGRRSAHEITPGHNLISNCHIYQKNVRHQKVKIHMSGVGNAFTGNLVHNSIGQAMVINGNDHVIELNEFFNIGYEEGDGGAMYSGGDMMGYGIVYRHNFFHHLMHVPGKVTRAGIHLDDRQAGATCIGNLFYKSAEKGIFMNGGAGHTLRDNVFLEGSMGIYNVGHQARKNHNRQEQISRDPKSPERLTKEDYVGRVERRVGKKGWSKPPWSQKYPLFEKVMSDEGVYGRMWPIQCTAENNFYYGNTKCNWTKWSRVAEPAMEKVKIENDREISPKDFAAYDDLDLRFQGTGFPKIPFERIGLHLSKYRSEMPEKKHYRKKVKDFFKGIGSMPGTNLQIDTAMVVEQGPVVR